MNINFLTVLTGRLGSLPLVFKRRKLILAFTFLLIGVLTLFKAYDEQKIITFTEKDGKSISYETSCKDEMVHFLELVNKGYKDYMDAYNAAKQCYIQNLEHRRTYTRMSAITLTIGLALFVIEFRDFKFRSKNK